MRNSDTSKRISLLMANLGISQKDLAERAGFTEATISRYAKGTISPNEKSICKIAEVTNVSPSWILGFGTDENMERII